MIRKYLDKGNIREINYFSFCADIDKPEDIFPKYVPKHPQPDTTILHGQLRDAGSTFYDAGTQGLDVINNRYMQKRVEIANNPSDIESRLQHHVVMKRVRIEEFFNDFDKLRKGKVTKAQFQSILSMLNFHLTFQELDALAEKYKTNDPEQMFDYVQFCANINSAFTTYGIQKVPQAAVAPVTVENTTLARKKYLDMDENEIAQVNHILAEYRKAI